MSDVSWGQADFAPFEPQRVMRRGFSQTMLCALALTLSLPVGLGVLYLQPNDTRHAVVAEATSPAPARTAPMTATAPAAIAPLRHYAAMLDPAFVTGAKSASFVRPAALRSAFEPTRQVPQEAAAPQDQTAAAPARSQVAEAEISDPAETSVVPALPALSPLVNEEKEIPLPAPRPNFAVSPPSSAGRRLAAAMPETTQVAPAAPVAPGAPAPAAPAQGNSFFDKLFSPLTRPGTALGYAAVEPGAIGIPGTVDRYTAVYDITAHTVTLPNGTRLEAHSGLGEYVDNPAGVALRMRGATPPNLYELTPREAIFHGVRALRMTPTGGTTYGRAGLLTHSYMLRGRSGESNGCVVFRNYEAFIAAYDAGQIRRLLVVARAG